MAPLLVKQMMSTSIGKLIFDRKLHQRRCKEVLLVWQVSDGQLLISEINVQCAFLWRIRAHDELLCRTQSACKPPTPSDFRRKLKILKRYYVRGPGQHM